MTPRQQVEAEIRALAGEMVRWFYPNSEKRFVRAVCRRQLEALGIRSAPRLSVFIGGLTF